jgi:hypothetical protein
MEEKMGDINVKQITNFDLKNKTFYNPDPNVEVKGEKQLKQMRYKTAYYSDSIFIKKFSYCCEPKAKAYPIFINGEAF